MGQIHYGAPMHYTPNRMESHWPLVRAIVQQEWDQLSPADLDYIDGKFDRLVEVIRQRYGGRVEIIQEAAIRDAMNLLLAKIEVNDF